MGEKGKKAERIRKENKNLSGYWGGGGGEEEGGGEEKWLLDMATQGKYVKSTPKKRNYWPILISIAAFVNVFS